MVEKKAQMGDFIGFSFNGIHSSELGLVRVSDGNRYEKNLFPAISDKTVQVPGRDGFYYFGSSYNTKELTIKVAFDNLEEKEFRKMVEHFKDKKPHFLWFDELPYKEYLVKIKSPPNFKYLCFDEWVEEDSDGEITKRKARIYKGEGTIIFVCYSPYARARAKSLDEEIDKSIVEINGDMPNFYHNTFLDGENQVDNENMPIYPPRIINETGYLTNGKDIRSCFQNSYLKLWTNEDEEEDEKNGYYSICQNLGTLFTDNYRRYGRSSFKYYNKLIKYDSFYDYFDFIIANPDNQNIIYNLDTISNKIGEVMLLSINKAKTDPIKPTLLSYYNFNEWYEYCGIPKEKSKIQNNSIEITNCGDIDMDIKILLTNLNLEDNNDKCVVKLYLGNDTSDDDKIVSSITIDKRKLQQQLDRYNLQGKDRSRTPYNYFFLDSKTKLLQAYDTCVENLDDNGKPKKDEDGNIIYKYSNYFDPWDSKRETKSVFNNCIIADDFFKIPADNEKYTIVVTGGDLRKIEYTYLYY